MKITVEHYLPDVHRKPGKLGDKADIRRPTIAERKFLFLEDGEELIMAVGPPFRHLADYTHTELRRSVIMRRGHIVRGPCGGGVAVISGEDILFEFWSWRVTGRPVGILEQKDVSMELERCLGLKPSFNTVSLDEPPY